MGQQAGTMTIANNGQGSGLWVTPVYKSHESDGFDADGLGYGSDITLYGVALGGDVTLANGVRVGAMFNVGSGDADGQGAASVVSNDFDYFGGSIYAGYAIDNLSIVGDISYTTIDSDVEANTAACKTSTSFDTTALSVGVTGQYSLKVAEMDVTPHAGMRVLSTQVMLSTTSQSLVMFLTPLSILMLRLTPLLARPLPPLIQLP